MKRTEDELSNIKKWINPKGKVRRCYKIEEDGTKTLSKIN